MEEHLLNIYSQLTIMNKRIDDMYDMLVKIHKKEDQLNQFETIQPNTDILYFKNKHLGLSHAELYELIKSGHDKHMIDIVINAIVNYKHNNKYETLKLAIINWLKVDPARPNLENEILLENGLPPVAEQLRLFPTATPITTEIIQNRHEKQDESKWKEEAFIDPKLVERQKKEIHLKIETLKKKSNIVIPEEFKKAKTTKK